MAVYLCQADLAFLLMFESVIEQTFFTLGSMSASERLRQTHLGTKSKLLTNTLPAAQIG